MAHKVNDNLSSCGICGVHGKTSTTGLAGTVLKETIVKKFNELLGDSADENRIMSETAAMLVKYTINEEVVRLHSHLKAMRDEINNNPVPGKKLDFICQETNREINTIGSKNQFSEVGAMVIKAKDSLENIREQSQNVE